MLAVIEDDPDYVVSHATIPATERVELSSVLQATGRCSSRRKSSQRTASTRDTVCESRPRRSESHVASPVRKDRPPNLITAIIEMKRRNPRFGCVRIVLQIAHAWGIEIDKDVVRRALRPLAAGIRLCR